MKVFLLNYKEDNKKSVLKRYLSFIMRYDASNMKAIPDDNFYTKTDYMGAFKDDNWMSDWTYVDFLGYIGTITDIEDEIGNSLIPEDFALDQNYPNPFNPTTNIRFELPNDSKVKLTVYNIRGQIVAKLVDGQRPAGIHNIQWNAVDMPSGIYLYKLDVGTTTLTKKLTLLK